MKRDFESLPDLFDRIAQRFAGETALEIGDRKVCYAEIQARSNRLAHSLLDAGARPGSIVAILSEDTARVVSSMLAVLKAGCAFLPMDLALPEKRLQSMLAQAPADWFLADGELLPHLEELVDPAAAVLCLDETGEAPPTQLQLLSLAPPSQSSRPEVASGPDDLAYIVFTSGSTGLPKPIAGRLKGIDHFIRWEIEALEVGPGTRVSQLASPSFDAFLKDAFVPLCAGGTVCVPEQGKELILNSRRLVEWVDRQRIEVLHMVPSLFRTLLSEDLRPELLTSLRCVLLAGEIVHLSDVQRWMEAFGERIQLLNMYGPSETTILKFCHKVTPADLKRRSIPIGKPIRGARALLLDSNMRVCAPGTVGEIFIRTPFRTLGYYKRPDLTGKVFIQNPFNSNPQDLIYKTGDFGRIMEDGSFEFLGRKDHQVKIRGVRIEMGEIESLLTDHDAIQDAAVVDREDALGSRFLCAYVVTGEEIGDEDLRRYMLGVVPEYMVPSLFVRLESLPRTFTGKVDRKALPMPDEVAATGRQELAAPRTSVEEKLSGIWAGLLRLKRVGIHQNFFALGGHSLMATQLLARVRSHFGVELPLSSLFQNPSVAGLASCLEEAMRTGSGLGAPPLEPIARREGMPLSFAQERFWVLDQMNPGNPGYNVTGVMPLKMDLKIGAVQLSLAEIMRRHEVLRTSFPVAANGRPVLRIASSLPFLLPLLDLRALPQHQRIEEGRRLVRMAARLPFDLARGPLLRVVLTRLAKDEHTLLLSTHHMVSDAWSSGIFLRELRALYEAYAAGLPSPLQELPLQYADFAFWQRQWLKGRVLEEQINYWKENLRGSPPELKLPADRPRPRSQSLQGGLERFPLTLDLSAALGELSRRENTTLYLTMLAALHSLLHRYSGQMDVCTGTPIANRTRYEVETLIGCFTNTFVLRTNFSGRPGFRQLLGRLNEAYLGATAHQHVPFELVVEALQPERSLSRNPLFQVMFVLRKPPVLSSLPSSAAPGQRVDTGTALFDLELSLLDLPQGIRGDMEYSRDLFDATSIRRLLAHYRTLLEGIVADPACPVAALPLLSRAEQHQLNAEWNAAGLEHQPCDSFVQSFERQSQRNPDAAAARLGQHEITYGQLNRRANQMARHLCMLGVGPEMIVGLALQRSPEMLVGLIGILKAGGAYLPLDLSYPLERLSFLMEDCQAPTVLTQESLSGQLPASATVWEICLDRDWEMIATCPDGNLDACADPDSLAYVIYTSGSTGRPKGVQVAHRSLANYLQWCRRSYLNGSGAGVPVQSSLNFDLTVTTLLAPLTAGEWVVMLPEESPLEALAEQLERPQAEPFSLIKLTPAHLRLLIEMEAAPRAQTVIVGGEALLGEDLALLSRRSPEARVINEYGPTEATVGCCLHAFAAADSRPGPVSIGRPIANNLLRILSESLQPQPVGVAGEICIGGQGLARDYRQRPALTARSFVPDPFSSQPGSRIYRAGDLARHRLGGEIEYLGRLDHQVKLRGYRVELGEVEAVLSQHPEIGQAAVLALPDASGSLRLAAYVSRRKQQEGEGRNSAEESSQRPFTASFAVHPPLADFLGQRLPEFMIPSNFAFLEALPLSPNGKVDRRALALLEAPAEEVEAHAAPSTPSEKTLATIWRELLGLKKVGVHDDFFDLGGHSLIAAQVISRVRRSFGIELSLTALFESPTVQGLASCIDQALQSDAESRIPPLLPADRQGELPLSFAQQRLWFLDQLEPGSSLYNVAGSQRLRGNLDVAALQASLNEILRRHEVLRTVFPARLGKPLQVIRPHESVSLPVVDLSGLTGQGLQRQLRRCREEHGRRPFDLASGPLLRTLLMRGGEKEHTLLAAMHHIVSDGWSIGILVREVTALYRAFASAKPSPLDELPIQYADYARWQCQWLRGETLQRQLTFWEEALQGAPPLQLPTDFQRPARPTYRGAGRSFKLTPGLSESLRAVGRSQEATDFMLLISALQALLSRYSGQSDVSVGYPIANRNRAEVEPLIGFFVNTQVLRSDFSGDPSFEQLLGKVRAAVLAAFAHQDVPFEQVVEALRPERSLSRTPLFQVMFALQGVLEGEPGLSAASALGGAAATAKFDLTLTMAAGRNGFEGLLRYSTQLFRPSTVQRMARHFRVLLEGIAAAPQRSVSTLPLMDSSERDQLLESWSVHKADYPRQSSIASLFEEQAESRPDAVALVWDEGGLSYGELNRRAKQVAGRLQERGTAGEALVGIFAERSAEMVSGLIGILQAGAAYLPLDPSYPRPRLAFMISDAGAQLILTQQRLLSQLPRGGAATLCLDGAAEMSDPPVNPIPPRPESLAYAMYTSGSTGIPKGVAVTQRGVVRLVRGSDYARLGTDQVFLQMATISFDASTFQIWGCLLNGGRLALFPARRPSLDQLGAALRRYGITMLGLPAALFRLMVEHNLEDLLLTRQVLSGGDVLSAAHARQALEAGLPRLINAYGPTENTTYTCCQVMESPPDGTAVPIGPPIANTSVYVLDRHLNLVPPGVAGELFSGGDGLARGYLNRPGLTAERFLPHPFADGERLYRTGDLVRRQSEGVVEFLGRLDQQLKIRGFRIEPGEVESALCSHQAIKEAVVLVQGQEAGKKRLMAYVVRRPDTSPQPRELRHFLEERLPDFMVPAAFAVLEALPLTPNGKLDRRALIEEASGELPDQGEAPSTPSEELIAGIWADVLGVESLGRDSNFFDLGGHSLLATQIVSRIRLAFGVEVPLRALFESPTLMALARQVEESFFEKHSPPPPLLRASRREQLPLSFAQQRLWFLDQLEPGNPFYNVPKSLRLRGRLDVVALQACLSEIVRRHEVLRSCFPSQEGRPYQRVSQSCEFTLALVDLAACPPGRREDELARLAFEEALRPFDLSRGPLLRAFVVRIEEEDQAVLATMHHIVSDAWSADVLAQEVVALYRAFSRGLPSPLQELPVQYADYACWQRQWLSGEVLEEQLGFWKERLAGVEFLELASDRPRPAQLSYRGSSLSFVLSPGLSRRLAEFSRARNVTLYMTLLTAFKALLHRYSGQADISVGSPIANRSRAETEGLIGFFINTLVMRSEFSNDPTFEQQLQKMRQVALDAYAHQEVPFELVVDALQPQRSLSRTPLFQAMFILQNSPSSELVGARSEPAGQAEALKIAPLAVRTLSSKFDLTLFVAEGARGLGASLEYSQDLFDGSTMQRLRGHFITLLEGAMDDPGQRVGRLPLIKQAEQLQVVGEWGRARQGHPAQGTLQSLFEEQAHSLPDALALAWDNGGLSYGELNRRANQVAFLLRDQGIRPESALGICLPRSPDLIIGLTGILKSGGAYLPLDPDYPLNRLAFMLEDSHAVAALTRQSLLDRLPTHGTSMISLERDWDAIVCQPDRNPAPQALPANLAYVIYTSGSTGRPKGVAVPHQAVVRLVTSSDFAPLRSSDVVSQSTNYTFDVSCFEIWGALLNGARLVLIQKEVLLEPRQFKAALRRHRVDVLNLTPALFNQCVRESPSAFASVRDLLLAGEALDAAPVRRTLREGPPKRLLNVYGPTENSIFSSWHEAQEVAQGAVSIPIGRPLANSQACVLDAQMLPSPIGVPGQLCLGGPGLARAYLQRPGLTAERFIPHPWGEAPGERLYQTGDRVRWLPTGDLDFMGRLDHQVKLRGFRIELGEIEAILSQHPAVSHSAVAVQEGGSGGRRLVAYVASGREPLPSAQELLESLKRQLPDYMLPSAFSILESLPLNASGKVDRKSLPEESLSGPKPQHAAPSTPSEELLAEIWSDLLDVEPIGRDDNFFDLGGHSLLATQVVSRIRLAFAAQLSIREFFEAQTLSDLALRIDESRQAGQRAAPPIRPVARRDSLPLSFAQERLWFLENLEPGSVAYNIPIFLRMRGEVQAGCLQAALSEVVRRHESLRTRFPSRQGKAVQRVDPPRRRNLLVVDLSSLLQAQSEEQLQRLARQEARRPFDLSRGPLFRAHLVRLPDQAHALLASMHHIVSDAWSIGLLTQELATLYLAGSMRRPSPLPNLSVQYGDFASWQRQWLRGEVLQRQVAYWKKRLKGAAILELPADRPRPARPSYQGAMEHFVWPPELMNSLKALGRRHNATLHMALLAAFQILLSRCSGQDDISVGTPVANRNWAETEGMIGLFVNTLVLRADLSESPSFAGLLQQVREAALGAYDHQDIPFEQVVEALQPERSLNRSPLFQVLLDLHNDPRKNPEMRGLQAAWMAPQSSTAKFDLTLLLREGPMGLSGMAEYGVELFEQTTIRRLLRHFRNLLQAVVADPDQQVGALQLLGEAERCQALREWNDTDQAQPPGRTACGMIESQAGKTPQAPALVFRGQEVTYEELDRQANQMACYLSSLGIGPETLVGICLRRSPQMIVAVLGVLKAGGAFLPLDPSYPLERLSFMLDDAGAAVVLTQEELSNRLPAGCWSISLDQDWGMISSGPQESPRVGAAPENLAYVMYTSGSTGRPKGVAVEQESLAHYLSWCLRSYFQLPGAGVPLHSPLSFDLSLTSLLAPLAAGEQILLLPEEDSLESLAGQLLGRDAFTLLKLTPSHLRLLAESGIEEQSGLIVLGGEALTGEGLSLLAQQTPRARLVNEYGPTEATVGCSVHCLTAGEAEPGPVPIGRPISNMRLYLLDRNLQPLPIGAIGQVAIAGRGLARGYLRRPRQTAQAFVPDPFAQRLGERMYLSGDLARCRADGTLLFAGRRDSQVKVRGFRIELGEVEAVLAEHPLVNEAVAMVREERRAQGRSRLVGYVLAASEQSPQPGQLREFLQERLPDYMVPALFAVLDSFPLTPNGKVDRQALPLPGQVQNQARKVAAPPRTPVETRLAEIWRDVLDRKEIGIEDNFFELGGDSILSIQIVARAAQSGLSLTVQQMFQHQTIAKLAHVAKARGAMRARQGSVSGSLPLTPIQRWFFGLQTPRRQHWNMSVFLQVDKGLDARLLREGVELLHRQHDALRLRFVLEAQAWRQFYAAQGQDAFCCLDLSGIDSSQQGKAMQAAASRLQASLDLGEGPIARFAHFDLGSGRAGRLALVVHHLAMDVVSLRILLEDLETACRHLSRGEPVQMPAKTTSYKHWAERLQEYSCSQALRDEAGYWLSDSRLRPAPLPLDHGQSINLEGSARSVALSLSQEETQALLLEVPKAYRTHINDVLVTALAQALSGWTGQDAVLLDLEGHGREELFEDVDLTRTVGWFTSIYPVLVELGQAAGPAEALKSVKEQLREVPGRGVGYGLLRYGQDGEAARRLASLGQAEAAFNYLGQLGSGSRQEREREQGQGAFFRLAADSAGAPRSLLSLRPYVLEINARVVAGRLQTRWTYSENLHRRPTVEALAQEFFSRLRELIEHCCSAGAGGYTPSDFPLARISQQELDRILAGQPQPEDLYPLSPLQQGMLFHSLFQPGEGEYVVQSGCRLDSRINIPALQQAWETVLNRHPVLRTSFLWQGLDEPLQLVHQKVDLSWEQADWRRLNPSQQRERFQAWMQSDRERGFDLSQPPVMRFALMQTAGEAHLFLWSFHHILLDGWSTSRVLKDVFASYGALCREEEPQLESSRPYRDYIAWLQAQDLRQAESFWKGMLTGFASATPLGVERLPQEGPAEQCYRRFRDALSPQATAALQSLGRDNRLTLNSWVQGAWALLLARYSGQQDILFGVTLSGRPPTLRGVESMVGLFINTLPLRVQATPGRDLLPWLLELQQCQARMHEYEFSPLVEVQKWTEVPPGQPLFESILVFENYPIDRSMRSAGKGSGGVGEVYTQEKTNFPLTLTVNPGSRLVLQFDFEASRLEPIALRRMLRHLRALLESMAQDPRRNLGCLPFLTAAERHQLSVDWTDSRLAQCEDRCLHELMQEQAAQTPDRMAVLFEGHWLSYRELDSRAERLAHRLREQGAAAGDLAGLCLHPSLDLAWGIYGILKAGAAYVPLDPSYPKERLALMVEGARTSVLVTQRDLAARLPRSEAKKVFADADSSAGNGVRLSKQAQACPENLLYVIFTSGSTGRPKMSGVSQRSFVNLMHWFISDYGIGRDDRNLLVASMSFDLTQKNFYAPLMTGGLLIVLPRHSDPERAVRAIRRERATCLNWTPSAVYPLVEEAARSGFSALTPLRHLVLGGEPVSVPRLMPWIGSPRCRARISNTYGPTECTDIAAFCFLSQPERFLHRAMPIGRPIHNARLRVLDGSLQLVPLGVAGELCIGGAGVGFGYLGDAALTACSFVPDAWGDAAGGRLYRTGDMVRWLPDACLTFIGRLDHQVKVRGFRIELGEVEAILSRHSGVREAAAIVREEVPEDRRLVAYVVPKGEQGADGVGSKRAESAADLPSAALSEPDLRHHLEQRLPHFMVPSHIVFLEALPLTPSGKLDRSSLPAVDRDGRRNGFVEPQGPVEQVLAQIWAEVLGVERVGATDSFFDLGGHSLAAMQVVSRVRDSLGAEIALAQLFEAPTVAGLAAQADRSLPGGAALEMPPVEAAPPGTRLPLSLAQEFVWRTHQEDPQRLDMHVTSQLRLIGPLDVSAFGRSLDEIVSRHDVLRTTYPVAADGQPYQKIAPAAKVALPIVDVERLDGSLRLGQVQRWFDSQLLQPFDLQRGPLIRFALFRLEEGDQVFLQVSHHILSDPWSAGVFTRELNSLYRACTERTPPPPRLAVQYADFAWTQRRWLTRVMPKQIDFWRKQLEGAAPVQLPTDFPRQASRSALRGRHALTLSKSLSDDLNSFSRRHGVTLFMTLLAGFKALLSAWSGQQDISIAAPIGKRGRPEVEPLIGLFPTTVIFRNQIRPDESFLQLLRRQRDVALGAYSHQDLTFDILCKQLNLPRELTRISCNYYNALSSPVEFRQVTVQPVKLDVPQVIGFDLSLLFQDSPGGLRASLGYRSDLFKAETIRLWAGRLEALLDAIQHGPRRPVSQLLHFSGASDPATVPAPGSEVLSEAQPEEDRGGAVAQSALKPFGRRISRKERRSSSD